MGGASGVPKPNLQWATDMNTQNTLLGKPEGQPRTSRYKLAAIVVIVVMLVVAVVGITIRMIHHAALNHQTRADATLYLSVVKPEKGAETDEISLPGTVQAFVDAPLYARTDGYLKAWYFDIGARVKKGQLIAVIETPEVDQELEQAAAAVGSARANYELAQVTNRRYQVLVKTNAVSKQEADQAASTEAAQKAALDAAIANRDHYAALQAFQKIYAPFDGIITARNTDVGQLVSAGIGSSGGSGSSGASGHPLFQIAALDKLRTFIPVPQAEAVFIKPGQAADLSFVERALRIPSMSIPGPC
jgi:RND family efflux transporter MFP subunit